MASALLTERHVLDQQALIDDALWKRLVDRIVKDENLQLDLAERIMNEALRFLALCAARPEQRYSPSPLVDIGWHTFILHTRDYADFCERIAGRFIHHVPNDNDADGPDRESLPRTIAALTEDGGTIDAALWVLSAGSSCGSDGDDDSGSACGSES